ncbi:MAG: tryptophan-rich sensory protein, partial [Tyzzerella sp.]|nr:tryptophan-rich sensory protein [Tyzzerella sp.]
WVLVLAMILRFWKIDKRAAWINIPYLVWLTFAGYLNLGIWWLN